VAGQLDYGPVLQTGGIVEFIYTTAQLEWHSLPNEDLRNYEVDLLPE
jgi:hypothetical protein